LSDGLREIQTRDAQRDIERELADAGRGPLAQQVPAF
jgi:hypothetical protein